MKILCKKKFSISIIHGTTTTTKYKFSLFCYIKFSQTFFEIYAFLPLFITTTNGLVSQIFFFVPSRPYWIIIRVVTAKKRRSGKQKEKENRIKHGNM